MLTASRAFLFSAALVSVGCQRDDEKTSLSLMDAATTQPTAETRWGRSWRFRHGLYENPVSGLRVRVPPGYHIELEEELLPTNPEADLRLIGSQDAPSLVVITEPAPEQEARALVRAVREHFLRSFDVTDAQVKSPSLPILGKARKMLAVQDSSGKQHIHVAFAERGRLVQLVVKHTKANDGSLHLSLSPLLRAFSYLSETENDELERRLVARMKRARVLSPSSSLLASTYRDWASGLRWELPLALYEFRLGDRARAVDPQAELVVSELSSGIDCVVYLRKRGERSLAEFHEAMLHRLDPASLLLQTQTHTRSIAGRFPARMTSGRMPQGALLMDYGLISLQQGNRVIVFIFSRARQDLDEVQAKGWRWAEGASLSSSPPQRWTGGRYHDLHLGFSIVPASGKRIGYRAVRRVDEIPYVRFASSSRILLVAALPGSLRSYEEPLGRWFDEHMGREPFVDFEDSQPTLRTRGSAFGVTHLEWRKRFFSGVGRAVLERNGAVFALLFHGNEKGDFQDALDSLRTTPHGH